MNLHMENQRFRFRVSQDELGEICAGQKLQQEFALPSGQGWSFAIVAHEQDELLQLTDGVEGIVLLVEKKAAERLLASLPNQEGFEQLLDCGKGKQLQLVFEVDMRSQKRHKDR